MVMSIQRSKADEQGLNFFATYSNIAEVESEALLGLRSPFIKTDEERIKQVLLGLQSNAIKFTENGEVETRVSII